MVQPAHRNPKRSSENNVITSGRDGVPRWLIVSDVLLHPSIRRRALMEVCLKLLLGIDRQAVLVTLVAFTTMPKKIGLLTGVLADCG